MLRFSLSAVALLLSCELATAGLVVGSSVVQNQLGDFQSGFEITNAINQSGLSPNYVSGSTDLASFLAADPTHQSTFGATTFASATGTPFGNIDFDLGTTYTINTLLFWQSTLFAEEQISAFQVFTSNFLDFSSSTFAGSFTPAMTIVAPAPVQEFPLISSQGRYVRFEVLDNTGSETNSGIGEIAFGAIPEAIPEASSFLLLSVPSIASLVGYLSFRAYRRRCSVTA